MINAAWIFALLLSSTLSSAQAAPMTGAPDACEDGHRVVKNTKITTIFDADRNSCIVTVDPLNVKDLRYRSYLFNQNGLLMVFNSFGDGPENLTTGARDFYFFPRRQTPRFDVDADGNVQIIQSNGEISLFDSENFQFSKISNAEIHVDAEIRPDNHGGVEVLPRSGLMLDCGFSLGAQPEGKPNGISVLADSRGQQCKLKNAEIFSYDANGDISFRFKADETFKTFLKTRCKNLDLSSL